MYEVAILVCGLITPRLILTTFGSEYNGVVSSITKFLSMISILNLGVAGSTRVALYKTLARDDIESTSGIVRATSQLIKKNAFIFIIYAFAIAFIYPFISKNEISPFGIAFLALILAIGTFAKFFFGYSYKCLLDADQKTYIYNFLQMVATIANTGVVYVLIRCNVSIYGVKLWSSICFAFVPICMNVYVVKKYKLNRKCEPDYSGLSQRKSAMTHSIANLIHQNVGLLVLTLFTTAKEISVYTVYNAVIGNIRQVMRSFTNGLEAAFGNMWAKQEWENLKNHFLTYEYIMYCFTAIVFSCVGVLLVPFIKLYTSGVVDTNYERLGFAIAMTVCEGIYCIREPYVTIVQAAGKYNETQNTARIEAMINVLLSLVLGGQFGIIGVVLAMAVANLYRTISYATYISKKILNLSVFRVFRRMLWLVLNVVINVIVISITVELDAIQTWVNWVSCGVFCFIIVVGITVLLSLLFYKKDFNKMICFCTNLLKRKRGE